MVHVGFPPARERGSWQPGVVPIDRNAVDPSALDPERCYRVVCARDARFDGWFVGAVTSTGIYCR
ncbi:MAG: hypothetical protein IT194_00535, partial [Microthrixaceae bacterium]|nr:hypothetical protein [Microthrixaceae bacterium]